MRNHLPRHTIVLPSTELSFSFEFFEYPDTIPFNFLRQGSPLSEEQDLLLHYLTDLDWHSYSKPEVFSIVTVPLPTVRDNDVLVGSSEENSF